MVATFLRPDADLSDGSWLNASSSNTDLYASVDESTYDDVDYIRSSIADGDTVRLRLSDPLTGVDAPLTVRYRCKSDGFPAQMYGILTQSTSTSTGLVAYWELEPTSSFATNTYTLSAAEFALITDFNDLYVSFVSIAQAPHLTGNIDLNFQTGDYYELGATTTKVSTDYLSCTRASNGYAKTAAGTLTSFGNDTLRITTNGLLVEDARTNEAFPSLPAASGGSWWLFSAGITLTQTSGTAPDGTNTAVLVTAGAGSDAHELYRGAGTAGTVITNSVYAKAGTTSWLGLTGDLQATSEGAFFNLSNGTIGTVASGCTASIEALANGWYRCIITRTYSSGNHFISLQIHSADNQAHDWTAAGTETIYVWGAQSEYASFASSPIPTTTAAATRAADVVTCIGGLNTILDTTSLSFLMDFIVTDNAGTMRIFDSGSGTVNCQFTSAIDGNFICGDIANLFEMSGSIFNGVKYAFAIDASHSYVSGNGGTVNSQASTTVSIPNLLLLGSSYSPFHVFGYIRRLTVWNTKLADVTLQALTAP